MKVNAAPMNSKLWTKGFTLGVIIIAIGAVFGIYRMIFGIGSVTNLSDGFPWGIWIAFDVVTGIALAAGGFTMAALVYIFNGWKYTPLLRPALITALLGYGLATVAIVIDVGRWWQVYNPVWSWNGTSPLFEVSLCVMTYLTILIIEFLPIAAEKFEKNRRGFLKKLADTIKTPLERILLVFIILGVVISTLHQSSLGSVMLIAKYRIHELWHSPLLPFHFLVSAIAIGFPMVVIESYLSARTFQRKVELNLLSDLVKITPYVLAIYMGGKLIDLIVLGKAQYLLSAWGVVYIIENLMVAVLPFIFFIKKSYRDNPRWIFYTSVMMALGIILNRLNTYIITYEPRPGFDYFPSIGEFAVTAMLIAFLFVGYKLLANYFPVLPRQKYE